MPVIWGEEIEDGKIRIIGISYTPKTRNTAGGGLLFVEVEEVPEGAAYYDPATGEFFTEEEVEEVEEE